MYYDKEITKLRDELEQIAADGTEVWWRQERARQLRFNEWEGQSYDGRKHADAMDGDAMPFEGAPDNRVPLIDAAIKEKVALVTEAFFRALVQVKPINSSDAAQAQNVSSLLVWLRDRKMREELETEIELSAQYLFGDDPGVSVVEVCWKRDLSVEMRSLTFDDLAAMYSTGASSPEEAGADQSTSEEENPDGESPGHGLEPEMLAEFQDMATNPKRLNEFVDWMENAFPGAERSALRAAATQLRNEGQADLPVPAIRENRPQVQALKLFDDIFFPIGTVDIQRARSVHRREWLTQVELEERIHTMGWDADWVDQVIAKGLGQSLLSYPLRWRQWAAWSVTLAGPGRAVNERDHLFEVWWSYRREADTMGVPRINYTVWNYVVKDKVARTDLADFPDGQYPYVLRTRERLGRQTTDSRGISATLPTHQQEIKIQRDARGVYVQMTATPPMKTKISRGAHELIIGPGSQVPLQKMEDLQILEFPNFMENSVEMEKVTRDEADHYLGLMRPDADPNRVALMTQSEVNNFLALWRTVFVKVLGLAQWYYSEEELDEVTGQMDMPLHLSADDIRGGFHVSMEIDSRDLNMEFAMKKMDNFGKVLGMDQGGSLDRTPFVQWSARVVDPILAKLTVQPAGSVTGKMVDEERSNVANMAAGIEPIMDPNGTTNPQFRLQVHQQTIQQSPKLRTLYAGADPLFRQLSDNYQKYLTQQQAQENNKLTGRLGTAPTQGVPGLYDAPSQLMAPAV